jgi:signal transduction histidine kinase
LLVSGESDEVKRRHLASIYAQAMRAHEMISDMMWFAHPPRPVLAPIDLTSFLRQCVGELNERFANSGWQVSFIALPGNSPRVRGDASQLSSLVDCLVQNATESRSQGLVEIGFRPPVAEFVEVEVRDNGPGVSDDALRHMFDPFYSGREAGRGLGFGLPKAWTIAQAHGGRIWVSENSAAGTAITIRLPLAGS